jgi:hypothetical protein
MNSRKDSRTWWRLAALAAVTCALAIGAPTASATTVLCPNSGFNGGISLFDSANNVWDFDGVAEVQDGGNDAFDGFGFLFVNNDSTNYDATSSTYPASCDVSADGRQITFPERDSPVAGLAWSRKVYVPATGTPFARWVDFLHNTTGAPIVLPTTRWGGGLGSDNQTHVDSDSDGNSTIADPNDDAWTTTSDDFTAPDHDPAVAEIWDGTLAGAADVADHLYTDSTGTTVWGAGMDPFATYDNVTVPPNGTIAYMHIAAVSPTREGAALIAQTLASGNAGEAFRGLTATDLSQIQNWNAADADGDGVVNAADNCMTDANDDQADLDNDGIGDVCDDDTDGDGISNANEAARGTDPAKADTDGDGKPDGTDVCPAKAGAGADGCPPFNSLPAPPAPPVVDKTPPVATVTVSKKAKLKAFLKGVTVKVRCNEPCTVVAELSGSVKKVTISKAYSLLLGRSVLAAGNGQRSLKLKPSKKLVGKAKKFSVQLKVTTKDASGNASVKTVAIKVG